MVRVLVRLDRGSTSFTNKAFMRQKLEARKSQRGGKKSSKTLGDAIYGKEPSTVR